MIKIEGPALALNDARVGGHFHLSRNIKVRQDDSRENLVACVAAVAGATPGGRIKNLVLNSHGLPGYLIMGKGFWQPHTSLFERWAGLIDNIWITACEIASRIAASAEVVDWPDWIRASDRGEPGDGYTFCREIAVRARCNVVAPLTNQDVPNHVIPNGYIDSFEGTVLCFRANGDIAWSHRYALHNHE
jgi:hypothetical protein